MAKKRVDPRQLQPGFAKGQSVVVGDAPSYNPKLSPRPTTTPSPLAVFVWASEDIARVVGAIQVLPGQTARAFEWQRSTAIPGLSVGPTTESFELGSNTAIQWAVSPDSRDTKDVCLGRVAASHIRLTNCAGDNALFEADFKGDGSQITDLTVANFTPGADGDYLQTIAGTVVWAPLVVSIANLTPGPPNSVLITNGASVVAWEPSTSFLLAGSTYTVLAKSGELNVVPGTGIGVVNGSSVELGLAAIHGGLGPVANATVTVDGFGRVTAATAGGGGGTGALTDVKIGTLQQAVPYTLVSSFDKFLRVESLAPGLWYLQGVVSGFWDSAGGQQTILLGTPGSIYLPISGNYVGPSAYLRSLDAGNVVYDPAGYAVPNAEQSYTYLSSTYGETSASSTDNQAVAAARFTDAANGEAPPDWNAGGKRPYNITFNGLIRIAATIPGGSGKVDIMLRYFGTVVPATGTVISGNLIAFKIG